MLAAFLFTCTVMVAIKGKRCLVLKRTTEQRYFLPMAYLLIISICSEYLTAGMCICPERIMKNLVVDPD